MHVGLTRGVVPRAGPPPWTLVGLVAWSLLGLGGCQTVYYETMEKFGFEKRDILADRVEDARDSQQQAKEQFQSALERFTAVTNFRGGALQEKYAALKKDFGRSEDKAAAVRRHIAEVEDVAEDLFEEWEDELAQYANEKMRRASKTQLQDTRARYAQLISAMRRAEDKMGPVLAAFRDQVLFLKHNLNARAIASLQNDLLAVEADIAALIRDMESSIAEANAFIQAMERT